MLTLAELNGLLVWNEQELIRVLQAISRASVDGAGALYADLYRLQNHRIVLKDCLIEALESELILQARAA